MKTQSFSKEEAIKFGWETTKKNFGFFILLLIVYGGLYYIPYLIMELAGELNSFVQFTFQIAGWILRIIISIGFLKILLKFCKDEQPSIKDLFSASHLFFKYLGTRILYSVIISIGFLLLIVPGIIFMLKFYLYGYYVVDMELGPVQALKRSAVVTKGVKKDLFFFLLALAGINIIGLLFLGVGLFATIPLTSLAVVYVYKELEYNSRPSVIKDKLNSDNPIPVNFEI